MLQVGTFTAHAVGSSIYVFDLPLWAEYYSWLMTPDEIEGWLTKAYAEVRKISRLPHSWWPTIFGNNQQHASAWMWAFFILAAKQRCVGRRLTLAATQAGAKGKIVDKLWPQERERRSRDLSPSEVLVDFSVHHWRSSNPVQLTAESEMFAHHLILDSEDLTSDDYSWDFYKLLVVPSQTRLFAARLGSYRGLDFMDRRDRLIRRLEDLVDQYGSAFLRPFDELGAVIIPTAKRDIEKTRVLWTDRGRLKSRNISHDVAKALRGGPQ